MTKPNEDSDERLDARRTSGATRRIVVQDLPPEEMPLARGRRLDLPVDSESTSRRSVAREAIKEHERPARLNRTTPSHQNTSRAVPAEIRGSARQTNRGAAASNKGASKRANTDQVNVKRLMLIIGGIVVFPFVVTAILFLLPSSSKKIAKDSQPAMSAPSPSSEAPALAVPAIIQSPPSEVSAAGTQPTIETTQNAASTSVGSAEIRSMTVQLASQISQKSGYEFAPEFVELIRARTQEYNSQKALGGARQYRREINKSFRDEGLNPLIGYALAMSRSKFDPAVTEKGLGIWQVPPAVARSQGYLGATENSGKLKIPEASAQITSSYTKQLLSAFDAEDFMYAIACFGMTLQDAGRLQARLVNAAPDTKSRRDIMKMIRAGVLTADQVDNIARFFAAGIVGENPQKFGLDDSQPFSSLY